MTEREQLIHEIKTHPNCTFHAGLLKPMVEDFERRSRPRYSFAGPFRYPSRALLPASDGSCFGVKRRTKGGVVLIDVSGSMGLSNDGIAKLMDMLPACTIAMYSSDKTVDHGMLTVLAEKGRRVKDVGAIRRAYDHSGGNVVDFPALVWLSKQQLKPHVWVSDGQVTGVGDRTGKGMVEQCRNFVREHGIIHIIDLPDAIEWIQKNPQYFVH